MKSLVFTCVTAAIYCIASPAAAETCQRETQTELTLCFKARHELAEQDLTQVYKWLTDALSAVPAEQEALREAQRAWIKFRDHDCHFAGHYARGGTMEPMLINQCYLERTRQREKELLSWLVQVRGY